MYMLTCPFGSLGQFSSYFPIHQSHRYVKLSGERKSPAGNRTWDLPIASLTFLPLSHWAHGRGAEASVLITAVLEGTADSSCLSLTTA